MMPDSFCTLRRPKIQIYQYHHSSKIDDGIYMICITLHVITNDYLVGLLLLELQAFCLLLRLLYAFSMKLCSFDGNESNVCLG